MGGFKDKRFGKPSKGKESSPTRFLYISGVGSEFSSDPVLLKNYLEQFGELQCDFMDDENHFEGIYMPLSRRYCFAIYKEVTSAIQAYEHFQNNPSNFPLGVSHLLVRYTDVSDNKSPPEPESTSETIHVNVPGLFLLEDFVSVEEEASLLAEYGTDSAPWKESLHRRVQHYGFPFNYRTLMVDYVKPAPPFPPSAVELSEKIIVTGKMLNLSDNEPLNQLTINEYWPNQGIASHTDTETCFGSYLFILNLGHGIVMNLTKGNSDESVDKNLEEEENQRKNIYLPTRSLLILSGEARYRWRHGISPRKFDKVGNQLVARQRRLSFTFRHVLKPSPIPTQQLVTGEVEKEHVVKVYDAIAVHWNHTRGKRKVHWQRVKSFIEDLSAGSLLADIGSGDGKYIGLNPNIVTIGCDRSLQLLQVSNDPNRSHETFCCDAVLLPLLSNSFDAAVCIAVLHHIATLERRFSLIQELIRIVKPGGIIFVQAWALEQEKGSKHNFSSQDTMVPWKLAKRFALDSSSSSVSHGESVVGKEDEVIVYQRFCHVFKEGELDDLCSRVPDCTVLESGYEKGNWFIKLQKISDERLSSEYSKNFSVPTAKTRL